MDAYRANGIIYMELNVKDFHNNDNQNSGNNPYYGSTNSVHSVTPAQPGKHSGTWKHPAFHS